MFTLYDAGMRPCAAGFENRYEAEDYARVLGLNIFYVYFVKTYSAQ